MIKRAVILAVLLASIVGAMAYFSLVFKPAMIAGFIAKDRGAPVAVETAQAVSGDVPQRLSGIGTIQAVHQVTVSPEVAGRVVEIMFEPGSTVAAGAPLIHLNDAPERADLANFEAQAHVAEINLQRSKELSGKQFASQQSVDQNESILRQAEAGIAKNKALIDQKLIRAPFSGTLGLRQADLGEYLAAGGAVVTLTDLDHLYVNFSIPEQSRSLLKTGQTVEMMVDAYPGRAFRGVLTTIEPQISLDTRNIRLQATFDNSDHALLPGMSANASVVLPSLTSRILLPDTAVEFSLYGESVFQIKRDPADPSGPPKAHRAFVHVGARFDGQVEVIDGVAVGDVVARSGQLRLTDGAPVTVISSDTLTTRPATSSF